ncbi:hypothetical protein DICPUDRAFT_91410 [Dictyostelium purpureum]|uniref:Uncharacterized protein n=1 Tax=Dictyostelium purpureum TaxID=5786 RepID=F0ZBW1_DICPU|nr:uncharacterized protein DICPUDRAFT_91410 [Dictyostelium purpureum]EGC38529.1 hypothetical protein DICPUDRAFT_91410 [Dictyostelium purpureum]|eukprot:XP_003284900.1 hypothetical protein DICPUDRAFT_91410 [Dictyostelium purpureum]
MSKDILFDNFIITHNKEEAKKVIEELWKPKHQVQLDRQLAKEAEEAKNLEQSSNIFQTAIDYFNFFKATADENPMLYIVAFSTIILPFVFCLIKPSKKTNPKPQQPSTTTEATTSTVKEVKKSSVKDEPSIESESSEDEKEKKSTVTKRTKQVK